MYLYSSVVAAMLAAYLAELALVTIARSTLQAKPSLQLSSSTMGLPDSITKSRSCFGQDVRLNSSDKCSLLTLTNNEDTPPRALKRL